jgi:hypothetical protein
MVQTAASQPRLKSTQQVVLGEQHHETGSKTQATSLSLDKPCCTLMQK